MSLDPSITTSANDDACDGSDYLSIPESSNVCQESNVGVNSRYCGQFLNFNGGLMANDVVCGQSGFRYAESCTVLVPSTYSGTPICNVVRGQQIKSLQYLEFLFCQKEK